MIVFGQEDTQMNTMIMELQKLLMIHGTLLTLGVGKVAMQQNGVLLIRMEMATICPQVIVIG